jgi:glutamate-5-semialdehyde dehydrogenase
MSKMEQFDNNSIHTLVRQCRQASRSIAQLSSQLKNEALQAMAESLLKKETEILEANRNDVVLAKEKGISGALIDRLQLNKARLNEMAKALHEVAGLTDPIGEIDSIKTRPNGIQVGTMRIPLGVILMIYEARPNVTSDAAALCLKAGNAVILRGGSEAFFSNRAIISALQTALQENGLAKEIITFIPTPDREALSFLLKQDQWIDLVIPRGGEGLIRFVAENSRIPVIKHYKGICHLFVDVTADFTTAQNLLLDGKLSRPAVCNALETLLVHEQIAEKFLPMAGELLRQKGVEIRGCPRTRSLLPYAKSATEEDYHTEYLDLKISIRVVKDLDQALTHLETYSTNHTDVIVTNDVTHAQRFLKSVQSAVVCVNASSRFSDGAQLGLGAEIGISTTKIHAYGPMGLEALTTKKFIVLGNGQTRHDVSKL